jgi:hypothetical protein
MISRSDLSINYMRKLIMFSVIACLRIIILNSIFGTAPQAISAINSTKYISKIAYICFIPFLFSVY